MPKKPCREFGCTNRINYDASFCAKHSRDNNRASSTKYYDKNKRDKSRNKFYHSTQWKRLRVLHLQKEPLCIICQVPGEIVDHIKEISDGGCATCLDNLQTLCQPCHNTKTSLAAKARNK